VTPAEQIAATLAELDRRDELAKAATPEGETEWVAIGSIVKAKAPGGYRFNVVTVTTWEQKAATAEHVASNDRRRAVDEVADLAGALGVTEQ
jgi:hypothetical protein